MSKEISQSILKTIAYFDIFDYPLSQFEIYKWLYQPNRVGDPLRVAGSRNHEGSATELEGELSGVINELDKLISENKIQTQNGFYFLPGRTEIVKTRMQRYNIAEIKYKKAMRIIKILSVIPYIKMIAVCNTLGYSNAKEDSDIDLFIVTRRNRIWITRFIALFFLKSLGLRPKGKRVKNKFCLSFFVTVDNLSLENLSLGKNDIHFQYWLTQFVPIYSIENTYEGFVSANKWVKNFLPNIISFDVSNRRVVKHRYKTIQKIWLATTSALDEKFYRWLQLKIMPKKLKESVNQDKKVVISNKVLKFHDNDRRQMYNDLWQRNVSALIE